MERPWTPTSTIPLCPSISGWHSKWDIHGMSMDTYMVHVPYPYVLVSADGTVSRTSMERPWTPTCTIPLCPSICGWHSNWDIHGMSMDTYMVHVPYPYVLVSADGTVTRTSMERPWTPTCTIPLCPSIRGWHSN